MAGAAAVTGLQRASCRCQRPHLGRGRPRKEESVNLRMLTGGRVLAG